MKANDGMQSVLKDTSTSTEKKKKKRGVVTACISAAKYELVRRCIEEVGIFCLPDEDAKGHAYLIWCDSVVQAERVHELKSYQRINHFPEMGQICRKDYLARNMTKMSRACPKEYHFIPRTWILPSEYNLLVLYWKDLRKRHKHPHTFIMKPANGAMGNGIHLFLNPERLIPHDHMIVQEYLDRPFLLDGYKMDLRLYVLVTHCDPLRAFIYRDGLVRLGTEKYVSPSESNADSIYMHLTNYSVNKNNQNFERHTDFDRGSKRSVKSLMNHLRSAGCDTTTLWRNIVDLVVKTLIVACPYVLHSYRMSRPGHQPFADSVCFEILGFDIFLDRKLKPWLLEVNRSPSFGADENVDKDIKSGVVKDALRLVNIRVSDKSRNLAKEKADALRRLLRPSRKHLTTGRGLSNAAKRQMLLHRRRQELKERLAWARKHAIREQFENENMNNFMRIFPSCEKTQQQSYMDLLQESLSLFLQSRSAPFQKNIIEQFRHQPEDEIVDLLEQCEIEELGENASFFQPVQSLSSMPELLSPSFKSSARRTSTCNSDSSSESELEHGNENRKIRTHAAMKHQSEIKKVTRLVSQVSVEASSVKRSCSAIVRQTSTSKSSIPRRPSTSHGTVKTDFQEDQRSMKQSTKKPIMTSKGWTNIFSAASAVREQEEELYSRTMIALQNTRIKFPGKSDVEAERILNNIMNNWKSLKSEVASYWLIKLDSPKRQKVIDIVRGHVRVIIRKTWIVTDVNSLRITRTFNRVFNRMQADHGQGLWSCFSNSGNSWETMFSKSSECLSKCELDCCRRIVQLCKDCLLIVYQFAINTKVPLDAGFHQSTSTKLHLATPPETRVIKMSHMLLPRSEAYSRFLKAENPSQMSTNNCPHEVHIQGGSEMFALAKSRNSPSIAKSSIKNVDIPSKTKFSVNYEDKRSYASSVSENLPPRFVKSTSLFGSSRTMNYPFHSMQRNGDSSSLLASLYRPKTDTSIKLQNSMYK